MHLSFPIVSYLYVFDKKNVYSRIVDIKVIGI